MEVRCQRSCGCPMPEGIQKQVEWGLGQREQPWAGGLEMEGTLKVIQFKPLCDSVLFKPYENISDQIGLAHIQKY